MDIRPIFIPVSAADLFDRMTVLQIKKEKIADEVKLIHIKKELQFLQAEADKFPQSSELTALIKDLKATNEIIWNSEELVRSHKDTDEIFLAQAHISHDGNDERFLLKQAINTLLGSSIIEVKSHQK